ncbi:MAG TPA: hypothetical protein VN794_13030 [Methylomirabilota bacterium]|jgi:hypothetical protein|nr:hypothetical protein [Methylomirabilota bacterium]
MNPELEALIKARDAIIEAQSGEEAKRLDAVFEARLGDVLAKHGGLSKESLKQLVAFQHSLWRKAQSKPSTLPPKA